MVVLVTGSSRGLGKELIIEYLKARNIEYVDVGTYTPESCDYPDIARKVAEKVGRSHQNQKSGRCQVY